MSHTPYNSPLLKHVQSWFETITCEYIAGSSAEAEKALQETLSLMGYGPPFDREQKCLNNFLLYKRANNLACLSVWGYYYDYKIASAKAALNPLAQMQLK